MIYDMYVYKYTQVYINIPIIQRYVYIITCTKLNETENIYNYFHGLIKYKAYFFFFFDNAYSNIY